MTAFKRSRIPLQTSVCLYLFLCLYPLYDQTRCPENTPQLETFRVSAVAQNVTMVVVFDGIHPIQSIFPGPRFTDL